MLRSIASVAPLGEKAKEFCQHALSMFCMAVAAVPVRFRPPPLTKFFAVAVRVKTPLTGAFAEKPRCFGFVLLPAIERFLCRSCENEPIIVFSSVVSCWRCAVPLAAAPPFSRAMSDVSCFWTETFSLWWATTAALFSEPSNSGSRGTP